MLQDILLQSATVGNFVEDRYFQIGLKGRGLRDKGLGFKDLSPSYRVIRFRVWVVRGSFYARPCVQWLGS